MIKNFKLILHFLYVLMIIYLVYDLQLLHLDKQLYWILIYLLLHPKDYILKIVDANDLHKANYLHKTLKPYYIKEHYAKKSREKK